MSAILDTVRRLIAETCAVEADAISVESRLIEHGLDSVRAMDLIISLEEAFDLEVPDEDVASLKTVQDLTDYLEQRVS